MTGLLLQYLILMRCMTARFRKYISIIIYLVYIGGMMILIRYCVMIIPYNKFASSVLFLRALLVVLAFPQRYPVERGNALAYGVLYSARAIFVLGILLFLVMLAVVSIIDYSGGILKIYVKSGWGSVHKHKYQGVGVDNLIA